MKKFISFIFGVAIVFSVFGFISAFNGGSFIVPKEHLNEDGYIKGEAGYLYLDKDISHTLYEPLDIEIIFRDENEEVKFVTTLGELKFNSVEVAKQSKWVHETFFNNKSFEEIQIEMESERAKYDLAEIKKFIQD